jgi:hypothetical protein
MRPIHLILAASLAANVLAVAAYFHTRRAAERQTATVGGSTALAEIALTPRQTDQLAATRRALRTTLQGMRSESQPMFDAALAKVRDARPGDTSYEAAVLATGEARRRQTLVVIRELIAFREHLTPAQREIFNRNIGEWSFIEAMIGLPPDTLKSPPSGPFRGPSPAPSKDGR